jgi:hypothetical protein
MNATMPETAEMKTDKTFPFSLMDRSDAERTL